MSILFLVMNGLSMFMLKNNNFVLLRDMTSIYKITGEVYIVADVNNISNNICTL